jgi:peptidoglycan hydrolase-like protein with peptidoglycan-binding domain
VSLLAGGLLLGSLYLSAPVKGKAGSARKVNASQKPAGKQAAVLRSAAGKAKTLRRKRRARHYHRLAKLRLQPQRVEEIQRALIQAGYLHEEPTGKWDDQTRSAMRRYQTNHGFPATGLPEAKSLMKLGLGPHPLPEDLDPTAAARASVDTPAQPNPSTDPPGSEPTAEPPESEQ